ARSARAPSASNPAEPVEVEPQPQPLAVTLLPPVVAVDAAVLPGEPTDPLMPPEVPTMVLPVPAFVPPAPLPPAPFAPLPPVPFAAPELPPVALVLPLAPL